MGQLLTPEEVCEKLGVSESTLRNWRRDHIGPRAVFLSSRKIRYREEDIESWVAERADDPSPALLGGDEGESKA